MPCLFAVVLSVFCALYCLVLAAEFSSCKCLFVYLFHRTEFMYLISSFLLQCWYCHGDNVLSRVQDETHNA